MGNPNPDKLFTWNTDPYRRSDRARSICHPAPCLIACSVCGGPTRIEVLGLPSATHTLIQCQNCHAHALTIAHKLPKRRSVGTDETLPEAGASTPSPTLQSPPPPPET